MSNTSLPDFLIIGASRSGTTSLHYYLEEHPEIFMSNPKELRFFDIDSNYYRGAPFYQQYFQNASPDQVKGESSPPYFHKGITFKSKESSKFDLNDDSASRIKSMLPNVKLIITLRNPVMRLYSQYLKNLGQGRETCLEVSEAIQEELDGKRHYSKSSLCWLYKNTYSVHLERWFSLFSREQILVLIFDEWINDTGNSLRNICTFLEVNPVHQFTRKNVSKNTKKEPRSYTINSMRYKMFKNTGLGGFFGKVIDRLNSKKSSRHITSSEYDTIYSILKDDIDKVEEITNIDLDIWRSKRIAD